jgi:hypothetical protein
MVSSAIRSWSAGRSSCEPADGALATRASGGLLSDIEKDPIANYRPPAPVAKSLRHRHANRMCDVEGDSGG